MAGTPHCPLQRADGEVGADYRGGGGRAGLQRGRHEVEIIIHILIVINMFYLSVACTM